VELSFKVNGINEEGSDKTLSETFEKLAKLLETGIIQDFTLTRTDLEQVFVNFAKFQIQAAADGHRTGAEQAAAQ